MKVLAQLRLVCVLIALFPMVSLAQTAKLDAASRTGSINAILKCLNESYVFPDVAKKMEADVRARMARKEYDAIEDGPALALKLTEDLRSVSHDLHIRVEYSVEPQSPEPAGKFVPTPEFFEQLRRNLSRENFGITKVDILKGNVGYVDFKYFAPPEIAAETYAALMGYLANTDALIIDVRASNGSMSPDAIPMLCTYFFEQPVHLNDIYWRDDDSTRQFWTWAYVPGKRYVNKPMYVLTSGKTFSGAEEFAYDLKNLKRATIIGDPTGGGANPGGPRQANEHFSVWIPYGRAINPITKTNWEGVGVEPDIKIAPIQALHTAHKLALKELVSKTTDPGWKENLTAALAELEENPVKVKTVTLTLKGFDAARSITVAGSFNFWSPRANPLTRQGDTWVAKVEVTPGRHTYKFVVDGKWILDPGNPKTITDGQYSNSVLVVE